MDWDNTGLWKRYFDHESVTSRLFVAFVWNDNPRISAEGAFSRRGIKNDGHKWPIGSRNTILVFVEKVCLPCKVQSFLAHSPKSPSIGLESIKNYPDSFEINGCDERCQVICQFTRILSGTYHGNGPRRGGKSKWTRHSSAHHRRYPKVYKFMHISRGLNFNKL
jgi:hypothetical protein